MEINPSLVKELREKTGAGMMDCKKALTETNGNFEQAVEFLRKKGLAAAAKKAGRTAAEGAIYCVVDQPTNTAAIVEINCETDFVARNEGFQSFVNDIAQHILKSNPENLDALMNQKFFKDSSKTINQLLTEVVSKIGENIVIRRFQVFKAGANSVLVSYIHGGGKIGVMVEVETTGNPKSEVVQNFAKDIAMHVAAAAPQVVEPKDVDPNYLAKEKEIFIAQLKEDPKNANKPAEVIEKIISGKLNKLVEEVSLMTQSFVKNPELTVKKLIESLKNSVQGDLKIKRFIRYQLGELSKN
jgi:elongation factor Ts